MENQNTKTKPDIRERLMTRGFTYPSDEELIMLIIGSGSSEYNVEQMAEKILDVVDVVPQERLVPELMKIRGVGQCKAMAVAAAVEFGRRKNCHLEAKIRSPKDIIPFVQVYAIKTQEHFISISLSGANEILGINVCAVGTVNRAIIHPREIFSEAIKKQAAAIIVCHNHPSGNCNPSPDDINTTRNLLEASEILGIRLLDHIIINKTSYFSFMEHKLFENQDSEI